MPKATALFSGVGIVPVTGRNDDVTILLFINDAVSTINATAPPSAQIALERFRFSNAIVGVPLNVV